MIGTSRKRKRAAKGPQILGLAWLCVFAAAADSEPPAIRPGRIVTSYALTAPAHQDPDDHDGSTPRDWRLLGSNDDGGTWQTIDARTNELFGQGHLRRVFAVTNQTSYNTYRLEVTRTRDATDTASLAELELMGPITGLTNEAQLRMRISSSRAHPLRFPAAQAFDGDPATDWFDFGLGQAGGRWLQCQYTTNADIVVNNIAQLLLIGRGFSMRDSFSGQASQVLSNFIALTNGPVRKLVGYSLTSANDFYPRDPADWQLLASNDGGKSWDVLDVRRNETFPRRLQKRDFALQKPASYALYRLQINSVFAPPLANSVQLAEIEPHWAEAENTAGLSLVVSARGENPPWEVIQRAFDRDLTTKWLDFSRDSTNRASWVQWQWAAINGPPVVSLNRLRAIRPQQMNPVKLDVQAVVVGRGGDSVSVVDASGFAVIHLTWPEEAGRPGDRVRLQGDLDFVNDKPLLMHPELTVLGQVQAVAPAPAGQSLAVNQDYVLGAIEGDAEFLTQGPDYATIRLTSSGGANSTLARILNPNRRQLPNPLNSRLRVRGVLESVADGESPPLPCILWVSRLNDVTLVAPQDKDWNQWPEYSVGDLAVTNFVPPGLVRVTGTVDDPGAGRYLMLKDGTNRIAIHDEDGSALPANSRVEALGFLDREARRTILRWAVCRPAGEKTTPVAMAIDAEHPVTDIGEVNRLHQANPDLVFPLRVRGVITYICGSYISDDNIFYLQDGTNAMLWLNATAAGLADAVQQEGMYVEIAGRTSHDGINPTGFAKFLGKGRRPRPIKNSMDAMMSPQNAGRWAQVEGVVSGYNDGRLTLLVEGKELTVWVNQITLPDPCRLPGSRLRVSGVCDPIVNMRDQILGLRLLVPTSDCIEIISPGPADPFLLPNVAIASLLRPSPGLAGGQMQMVRSEGIVTYKGPRLLCLQDKDSGMRVFLQREYTDINPGDRVQVAGLALPDGFTPKLVQALVRKTGRGDLPAAGAIDFMQSSSQSPQDTTRGQVDAIFDGQGASDSALKLEMHCEATRRDFYAYLPATAPLPPSLLPGTRVRLRGVIKLQVEEPLDANQVVTAFEMYLNSPADIQVLEAPSWWTARHTLWVVGGLGTVLIVSLGWIGALRLQVGRQTRALKQENVERKLAQAELAAVNAALQKENLERKQAQETLRSQEEVTRLMIDQAFDAVITTDIDYRIIGWNRAAEKTLGWARADILGRNLLDTIVPPSRRETRRAHLERFRATGEWPELDRLIHTGAMHRDGRELPVELTITPIRLGDHCILTHFLRDITERKGAETALAHERHLLESLLDNSADCIYFKDRDSRILRCSKSQSQRFGGGAADLIGKTDFDLLTEECARPAFEDEQQIIRSGRSLIGKVERQVAKDGRESWALTSKMPLRNQAGDIVGTFGISKDISDLKRTETQLAHERDLLTTLLDNTPDLIYFKDVQSRFVRVSRSMVEGSLALARAKQQGSSDDKGAGDLPAHLAGPAEFVPYLLDKTDFDLYPEERARSAFEDEQEIIRTGEPMAGKIEKTLRPDGQTAWIVTTKLPWRALDGQIIGTFGISKDVTFVKEAEAKLEHTHKKLVQASRMAGMAEVATNVLHNVGNALNSINIAASMADERIRNLRVSDLRRLAQLLEEHAGDRVDFLTNDPKGRKVPDFIGHLAERLGSEQAAALEEIASLCRNVEHVKEIIAMQQSYAGVTGVFENIQVTDLLEDSLHINAESLARHEVKVVRDYGLLPPICTDKHKAMQILINLVSNAKYACDESGRSDKQVILRATNGEGRVTITVIDNGVGIPPENLTRIFNHGFTTRKGGHGFGLHSSALAAKELGGSLTVHSEGWGLGAVFTLELPCQRPASNEIQTAQDRDGDDLATPE
jgi:PAS domain S-box-containing protein